MFLSVALIRARFGSESCSVESAGGVHTWRSRRPAATRFAPVRRHSRPRLLFFNGKCSVGTTCALCICTELPLAPDLVSALSPPPPVAVVSRRPEKPPFGCPGRVCPSTRSQTRAERPAGSTELSGAAGSVPLRGLWPHSPPDTAVISCRRRCQTALSRLGPVAAS